MHISPRDFYDIHFSPRNTKQKVFDDVKAESICCRLPHIEIAHLHGEYAKDGDMYLDFIYDEANDKPYFRMLIIDGDDFWSGTEIYHYMGAEDVHGLLIKNGIDVFRDMTEFNWKSYIGFAES